MTGKWKQTHRKHKTIRKRRAAKGKLPEHAPDAPMLTDPPRLSAAAPHSSLHLLSARPRHPHKPRGMAPDDCHPSATRERAADALMPLDTDLKLPRGPVTVPARVRSPGGPATTQSSEHCALQTSLSFNVRHNIGRKADPRLLLNRGDFRTNLPIHVQNLSAHT